jgi:hypothetical protein
VKRVATHDHANTPLNPYATPCHSRLPPCPHTGHGGHAFIYRLVSSYNKNDAFLHAYERIFLSRVLTLVACSGCLCP